MSSLYLTSLTTSYETDNIGRLSLGSAARAHTWGNTWNHLRLVLRCGLKRASSESSILGGSLLFGFCSGTSTVPGTGGSSIPYALYRSFSGTWDYDGTSTPACWKQSGVTNDIYLQVGTIQNNLISYASSSVYLPISENPGVGKSSGFSLLALDIVKTDASWKIVSIWPEKAGLSGTVTRNQAYNYALDPNPLSPSSYWAHQLTVETTVISSSSFPEGSSGYLNSAFIYWNKTLNPLDLADVFIVRYY